MVFNVDMKGTGLYSKDTTINVGIKGDVEPLNWTTGIVMTDTDKDGVYSAKIDFDPNGKKKVTFKYVVNNVEWEGGENLTTEIKHNAIPYNSNFRYVKRAGNPFKKFIGEWTLKDDYFEHGSEENVERTKIPNHHTICKEVNTENSLLWIIDAPSSKGHIFWTYNHQKKEVNHNSSFYSYRSGVGKGSISQEGDVTLKISFEDEPEGSYRIYNYKWITDDEFQMKSVQYDASNKATGSFYGGTFVRMRKEGYQ